MKGPLEPDLPPIKSEVALHFTQIYSKNAAIYSVGIFQIDNNLEQFIGPKVKKEDNLKNSQKSSSIVNISLHTWNLEKIKQGITPKLVTIVQRNKFQISHFCRIQKYTEIEISPFFITIRRNQLFSPPPFLFFFFLVKILSSTYQILLL